MSGPNLNVHVIYNTLHDASCISESSFGILYWPCNRLEHRFQLHIIYPRGISVRIFQLVKMVYWLALQIYSSHIYIIPLVISIGNNFKILLSLRNGKIPNFNFSMRLIVCKIICIQWDSVEPMIHGIFYRQNLLSGVFETPCFFPEAI